MPLTLKIKPTLGGDTFPVQTEPEATIADLKVAVAEVADTEASGLRLIYRGMVLKDGQTVESYGERDHHMAKSSAAIRGKWGRSTPQDACPGCLVAARRAAAGGGWRCWLIAALPARPPACPPASLLLASSRHPT